MAIAPINRFNRIPDPVLRNIFPYLEMDEFVWTAATCKRMLKQISAIESKPLLERYVGELNNEIRTKNREMHYNSPIPEITILPNETVLKQLQDYKFSKDLKWLLGNSYGGALQRSDRMHTLHLRMFSILMVGMSATSSASLSSRVCLMAGNILPLAIKPKPYFHYHNAPVTARVRNLGMAAIGAFELGAGLVFLAGSVFSENPHGSRFAISLIGTGAMTLFRADNLSVTLLELSLKIDHKYIRARMICSAYTERAMRRSSCCLKVSSTLGAIKRYAAEKLFGLMRIAASPL